MATGTINIHRNSWTKLLDKDNPDSLEQLVIDNTKYSMVHIVGTFSSGACATLDLLLNVTNRADGGYYYNGSTNAGYAAKFTTGVNRLDIYQPYVSGSASSYTNVQVWALAV